MSATDLYLTSRLRKSSHAWLTSPAAAAKAYALETDVEVRKMWMDWRIDVKRSPHFTVDAIIIAAHAREYIAARWRARSAGVGS